MKGTRLLEVLFLLVLFSTAVVLSLPIGNPEAAIESMRQIPQWHCLRYRKFDLVRRCRNYRIGRKH
ncbi:uncharacterized protein LOC105696865 [Orussus abietinus]|uniref:uncharacterized protein LOC105696865 n=1 Tax=Orussus abietinus TaxID=222816 RepID=UPI000625C0BF|nr:uncharacterized protein LOC105696865 [Orussus abietinus]